MPDPFVFTKLAPYLQRIQDAVRTGHRWYILGTIPPERAQALHDKFDDRYALSINAVQASRRRAKGTATAKLMLYEPEQKEDLHWILLRSEGELLEVAKRNPERWRDAMGKDRIEMMDFELVRITKKQEPKPVWTWRYKRVKLDSFKEEIRSAIRHKRNDRLMAWVDILWRKSPGFAGVRDQVDRTKALIRAEWKRSRGKKEQLPELPKFKGYIQRVPDRGQKLSTILKNDLAAKVPAEAAAALAETEARHKKRGKLEADARTAQTAVLLATIDRQTAAADADYEEILAEMTAEAREQEIQRLAALLERLKPKAEAP